MNTADRLKEERERLGLSQSTFGEIGGVKKLAQINYEKGERAPDTRYLEAIAAIGADVQYIITGIRSTAVVVLKPEEAALLDNYRYSPEDQKRLIRETSAAFAQRPKGKKNA